MVKNGEIIDITYAGSTPLTMTYDGATYYYVVNGQGDVIGLADSSGAMVIGYTYSAWGEPSALAANATLAPILLRINPLLYRGYVYDIESKLYYLQSRYYDPAMGRFISADALVSTGQGLLGNNMFTYCQNNPVNMYDPSGTSCCYIFLSDDPFADTFYSTGGGGGVSSYGAAYVHQYAKDANGSGVYKDTTKNIVGGASHGQIIPWEFSAFEISSEGVIIIDANVALCRAYYEWNHMTLTPFEFFSAEASAGITSEKGLHLSAMASILSPSATFEVGGLTVTTSVHVGAIGGEFAVHPGGFFKFGFALHGLGGSITVTWDNE